MKGREGRRRERVREGGGEERELERGEREGQKESIRGCVYIIFRTYHTYMEIQFKDRDNDRGS